MDGAGVHTEAVDNGGRASSSMAEPVDQPPPQAPGRGEARDGHLDSWKEIAAHLGRDVRTVQRWERGEGLPVHRHQHDKLGSVYAFRDELDAWKAARSARPDEPRLGGTVAVGPTEPVADDPRDVAPPPGPDAARPGRYGSRRVLAVGFTVLVIVLGAWLIQRQRAAGGDPTDPAIGSIVVLPFENLSTDPGQDFFAAGLTEEITGRLAQLTRLRVVSRTSAASLPNRKLPVSAIAEELDVDAVIEGSVRREAGRVRVSIQLIHAPTDRHLWARDFEGEAAAAWPLQIEVAQAVADRIRVQATPEERARLTSGPPVSAAAHDEYLLGRFLLWKFIEEDRVRAIAHFTRAIELQPDYASPYAALAHAWWMRGVFGPLGMRQVAAPAREAALAALARDAGNVEALSALAYVQGMFDWDWSVAEATIRRAVTLEPNNVDVRYVHSLLLMALGRLDGAVAEIDVAARLDPLSAQMQSTYGRILYRARRFDEAHVRLERALELEPRNISTYVRLVAVLEHTGRYDAALAMVEKMEALGARPAMPAYVTRARILARAGRETEARRLLARGAADAPLRAEVLAALSDRDGAFASLFRALEERESWPLFIKSDPAFESLHGDPRWTAVLRRMHLE
jgi:TolB-like protein/Tfp pilus assembly protein PilF